MKKSAGTALVSAFFIISSILFSCTPSLQLPGPAQDALRAYWQSLPASSDLSHRIIRAWPGSVSPGDSNSVTTVKEIWCVEAEVSAHDPLIDGERMIWIVIRENDDVNWSAALLATMSSTWPYEACGTSF